MKKKRMSILTNFEFNIFLFMLFIIYIALQIKIFLVLYIYELKCRMKKIYIGFQRKIVEERCFNLHQCLTVIIYVEYNIFSNTKNTLVKMNFCFLKNIKN